MKNKYIVENKLQKDDRNQIDPNKLILMFNCGFEFMKYSKKNCKDGTSYYYNIMDENNENNIFHTELPIQVYYTNKIINELSKNEYFAENYMEGCFIESKLIKIEEEIINFSANYSQKKYLDFSIHSKNNNRHLIAIEINEYEHNSKQTEDEKQSEDLRARRNSQGYTIIGPFVIKLNGKGEIDESESEFNKFIKDVLSWLKKLDEINDNKHMYNFVVNYLVEKGIGVNGWCKLLYNSYKEKDEFSISTSEHILPRFGLNNLKEKPKKIISNFVKYRDDYLYRWKQECKDNCEEIKSNYKEIKGDIFVNFDGFVNFCQFLFLHEEYFKYLTDYEMITSYYQKCQVCMMDAISDVALLEKKNLIDMLRARNKSYYYGGYK